MSIKILKPGLKPHRSKVIYTIKCPKCECVYECETEDFKALSREPVNSEAISVCPDCGYEFSVMRSGLPSRTEDIEDD